MTFSYIRTESQYWEALTKQIYPYYKSQKSPLFGLDVESYSYYTELNKNFELYNIPKPIRIPPRQVSRLWDKKEFTLEYEGYSSLFQLGANPRNYDMQWLFDVKTLGEDLIAEGLKEILESSLIIGHNLKYEAFFLTTQYDIWLDPEKIRDLMIIEQIDRAGTKDRVGLGDCYRRNLDYGFFLQETGKSFKDYLDHKESMQTSDWAGDLTKDQLQYGADDVRLIFYLYEKQKERANKFLKQNPKSTLSDIIKFECAGVIEDALIELRGIDFDSEYHNKEVLPYLETKKKESYEIAAAICPNPNKVVMKGRGALKTPYQEPINFGSPVQVPATLKLLGIKVPNAQEDTLKAARSQHYAVQAILNYKKATTLLSSFGYKLPRFVHEDGKIHGEFRRIGTETARFSSKNPNIQQIPKKEKLFREVMAAKLFRRLFICRSPYILTDCDLSAIEPRLIAQRSKDKALIQAFNDGVDYHGFTAKNLLKLDYIPKKGTHEREVIGKIGNLALGYLAGDARTANIMFVETLDEEVPVVWSLQEAAAAKTAYFDALPQVKEMIDRTKREVWDHFNHFTSLAEFKNRRPIYVAFTDDALPKSEWRGKFRRHRSWYLTEKQEALAKFKAEGDPREHPLHRDYVVWEEEEYEDPKTGEKLTRLKKSNYNQFKRMQGEMIRELYNFRIQAVQALILKIAMRTLSYFNLQKLGFDIWNEGIVAHLHDELLFKCHESKRELVKKMVQDAMVEAGEVFIDLVPVLAEPESGMAWYME